MNRIHTRAIAAAFALALTLAACGGDSVTETVQPPAPSTPAVSAQPSTAPTAEPGTSYSTYVFLSGDFAVSIDQDMSEVLSALGEPQSYFEAASCAFEGLDKTYTYDAVEIITYPDGDLDRISYVRILRLSGPHPARRRKRLCKLYPPHRRQRHHPRGTLHRSLCRRCDRHLWGRGKFGLLPALHQGERGPVLYPGK